MSKLHYCVHPTMISVEPALERMVSGSCPDSSTAPTATVKPVILFRWLRFPRLRRQEGLATGIIGLW